MYKTVRFWWECSIAYPLGVLVGSDEEMNDSGQGTVFPQRGMVGRAQGQIPDEADHCFDEGPPAWGVEQLD